MTKEKYLRGLKTNNGFERRYVLETFMELGYTCIDKDETPEKDRLFYIAPGLLVGLVLFESNKVKRIKDVACSGDKKNVDDFINNLEDALIRAGYSLKPTSSRQDTSI
ncbi:Uncharacterised protein [uncultured archaeon]|nr:Uncharacterised protein [uncultured archaeon]